MVKTLDCQSKAHKFKSHQLPLEKKIFFNLATNPGISKIVNLGPGSGWGKTRPLAVSNSGAHTTMRGIVSAPVSAWPASGICLAIATAPEFPEVIYMGHSLNWGGGAYPIRKLLTSLVLLFVHAYVGGCVCVDVCVCVCGCVCGCAHVRVGVHM